MINNFSKYQGLGNDFIIFDARSNNLANLFSENKDNFIEHLCNRNFGKAATLSSPRLNHFGSKEFCFESYLESKDERDAS